MLPKLREKRANLLREAEGLKNADGSFENDEKRAAFDKAMSAISDLDVSIRTIEAEAPPAAAPATPAAPAAGAVVATIGQVRTMATSVGLTDADAIQLAERAQTGNLTIEAVRSAAIDLLAARHEQTAPASGRIEVGADADDKFQRGTSAWLIQRMGLSGLLRQATATNKLPAGTFDVATDPGEFRGMTLIDIARECLERRGVKTRGMNRDAIAGAAFTMRRDVGGLMSTGDFPTLLENVLHKILQAGYATQPDTWSKWCKRGSVTDFRAHNRYRMSSFSSLDALTPSGEFKNKALGDAEKASITAGTKGNIIGINRQLMVNDDLGALTDLASMLGRAAMLTVEVDAYAMLALNAGLGPTVLGAALFDATHNNITTSAPLTAAALDIDSAAMAAQKDPSGNEVLDLQPAVLLVARGLKGQANVINASEFDPDNIATGSKATLRPNVSRGMFREIVGTPRLTGTRRYLFADPNVAPVFEVAFLEGQEAPVLESKDGWRFDGAEMRVRLDYGTAGVDYRGAVTNAGA